MSAFHHTIVTGQSLANGAFGGAPVSTNPQTNARLHRLLADGTREPLSSPPTLQEPQRTLAERAQSGTYEFVIATNNQGGIGYTGIKKGTAEYEAMIAKVQSGYTKAAGDGDTFDVAGLHIIHGESDTNLGTSRATYAGYLAEWVSDINADAKAITGQPGNLKAIISQTGMTAGAVAWAHLDAHRAGTATLACPRGILPTIDYVHLTAEGYYKLGEYHGLAHKAVVIDGGTWHPVHPLWIKRTERVITVKLVVPTPPIVIDNNARPAGFYCYDDSGEVYISSVEAVGDDVLRITLGEDAGTNVRLRYGTGTVHDSATAVSALDGAPLQNWLVRFDDPVPFGSPPADVIPPAVVSTRAVVASIL